MINISLTPSILLGVFILIGFSTLFFLRTIKYEISRDVDLFFSSLGFIYSLIILLHGWRLDPILFFGQLLVVIIIFGLGWENIRLRGIIISNKNEKNKNG